MASRQRYYQVPLVPCSTHAPAGLLSEEARDLILRARRQANQLMGPSSRDRARLLRKLSWLWAAWRR